MANTKKRTTFAKLNRENALRERRLLKQAKREARRLAGPAADATQPEPAYADAADSTDAPAPLAGDQ